jgi:hypothetical protein
MDKVPPAQARPMMMNVGSKLADRNVFNALQRMLRSNAPRAGSPVVQISLRTGRSFIMLVEPKKASDIKREDLVEVADYDPARHTALYVGKAQPGEHLTLFWFVYRAFEDVGAIAVLPAPGGPGLPAVQPSLEYKTPQACMGALPFFKSHRAGLLSQQEAVYLLRGLDELGPLLVG